MKRAVLFLLCFVCALRVEAPGVTVSRPEPQPWAHMGLPDPSLMARLIMAESGGNPYAVSSAGAVGLCQIMPSLARSLGADPSRLFDPDYNLAVGSRWLGTLIARYGVDGGLRAYLMGETNKAAWYCEAANLYVKKIKEEL